MFGWKRRLRHILGLRSTLDDEHRRDLGAVANLNLVANDMAYEAPWNDPHFITSTKADYLNILDSSGIGLTPTADATNLKER